MKISIARARIPDVDGILELQGNIWRDEGGQSNRYDMCDWISHGYAFVAKHRNRIVGAITAFRTSRNELYVTEWIVDKEYRRKGIGSRLYRRLISTTQLPILSILSTDYKESVAGHSKLGFRLVKRLRNPYGLKEKKERLLVRRSQGNILKS